MATQRISTAIALERSPDPSRAARARLGLARPLISRCSLRTSSSSVSPIVCATRALPKPRTPAMYSQKHVPSKDRLAIAAELFHVL